eukprot:scaffold51517_cov28-Cyclotella_meneghiniana.AAC.1
MAQTLTRFNFCYKDLMVRSWHRKTSTTRSGSKSSLLCVLALDVVLAETDAMALNDMWYLIYA